MLAIKLELSIKMDQANTEELILKLISGTYEEFCKNIVVFLEIVSIHFEVLLYLLRNIIYVFLVTAL